MTVVLALVVALTPTETLHAEVDLGQDRPHFVEIDAGADHACGHTATGRVLCWGSSVWGQLGDGRIAATDDTPLFGPSAFGGPARPPRSQVLPTRKRRSSQARLSSPRRRGVETD